MSNTRSVIYSTAFSSLVALYGPALYLIDESLLSLISMMPAVPKFDLTVWTCATFETGNMQFLMKLHLHSVQVAHHFGSVTGHLNVPNFLTITGTCSDTGFFMHRDIPMNELPNLIVKIKN